MACNESLDFQQAITLALQRLPTPSMVLQIFNSPLALRTHEIQQAIVIVQRYIPSYTMCTQIQPLTQLRAC